MRCAVRSLRDLHDRCDVWRRRAAVRRRWLLRRVPGLGRLPREQPGVRPVDLAVRGAVSRGDRRVVWVSTSDSNDPTITLAVTGTAAFGGRSVLAVDVGLTQLWSSDGGTVTVQGVG